MPSNREILDQWISRVWLEADFDAVNDLFAPDGEAAGLFADMTVGVADFGPVVEAFLGLVEEPQVHVDRVVEQGDWLSALITLKALSQADGRPVTVTGQMMMRFRDGQVAEAYNHFDYVGFFEQMGMLPKDALVMFLSGAPLA